MAFVATKKNICNDLANNGKRITSRKVKKHS